MKPSPASSPAIQHWMAPRKVADLRQNGGDSSWSTTVLPNGRYAAVPLNHEPDVFRLIRSGRTPGRALRNTRRFLAAQPVIFG